MSDPRSKVLVMWTIYAHPADFPDSYVVRGSDIMEGQVRPHAMPLAVVETLEQARAALPPGLMCMGRHDTDEPQIVESWF